MLRDEDLRVLQSVHTVLEAIRSELRDEQKRGSTIGTHVALLDQRIGVAEREIATIVKSASKRAENEKTEAIENAKLRGADKVKWAIAGTLGGSAALYVLQMVADKAFG